MNPDFTIIGAGIAGCTLAWQLKWLGRRVTILDRDEPVTASKVAAGLINPITGKRLAVQPQWDFFLRTATVFYQRIERETHSQLFHQNGMVRILRDNEELDRYEKRSGHEFKTIIANTTPPLPEGLYAPFGSFQIPSAARLDVNRFCDVTANSFQDSIQRVSLSVQDIAVDDARLHVFCTGIAARNDFPANCFQPAKGELMTIRVRGLEETRIVNHGVWLMPLGNEIFRFGATYSWDQLDSIPTPDGRAELIRRLQQFLKRPFEEISHQAATRPILTDRKPMLGTLPGRPQIAVFNGLGSKGALLAPFYSQQLAEHLVNGSPIDSDVDVKRFYA